jgi:hypothetical protein
LINIRSVEVMKYTLIYNLKSGASKYKDYTNSKEAFERFWKLGHSGQSPLLTSDNVMGGFDFRNIQGFRSRPEGKQFAYKAFMEYMRDYRK